MATSKRYLDVVVLSRSRNEILKNSIKAWGELPYKFHIFHNSEQELIIDDYTNLEYFHCPGFNFSKRAILARETLEGEFAMLLADDDRLVPSGVESTLNLLRENTSMQSAAGKVFGTYRYGTITTGAYAYSQMYNYSNHSTDTLSRLNYHFYSVDFIPQGGLYRIYRRESFRKLLKLISESGSIKTPYVYELIGEFANAFLGPTSTVDEVYWIRNWQNKMSHFPDWDRNLTLNGWWNDDSNSKQIEHFIDSLARESEIDTTHLRKLLNHYISKRREMDNRGNKQRTNFGTVLQSVKLSLNYLKMCRNLPQEIEVVLEGQHKPRSSKNLKEVTMISRSMFNLNSRHSL